MRGHRVVEHFSTEYTRQKSAERRVQRLQIFRGIKSTDQMGTEKAAVVKLLETAPTADALTAYDERHFAIYLGLLHANADGLGEDEMCRTVLGVDPQTPGSKETLRSHLERARWFSTTGYLHLLDC